jgi:autotransporter-associated beta strand protein
MADPGNNNRDCYVSLSTGTVTVFGNITMNGAAGRNQVTFTGAGTLNVGGNITGGNLIPSTGTVNYYGDGTGGTSSSQTIGAYNYNNLITSGNGTKTLAAATPTVSGALTVKAGTTLALSTYALGASAGPTSVVMEIGSTGSTISGTGLLHLGGNVTVNYITGSSGATISCPIALDNNRIFTVADDGTSATDLTVSGVISTSFGVTKAGLGTMTLSGSNTYTGATTINAGTLQIGASTSALGTVGGITSVASGAVLDLNGFNLSNAEPLTLYGAGLTASPAGALTNTGGNASYSGPITLGSASTITATSSGTITCSGTLGTGTFALTLDGTAGSSGTMSGIITTPTSITKNGAGTWILSGTNNYAGATTISEGTLKLGASTSVLGTPVGITSVTSGAVLDLNGFVLSNAEPLTIYGTGLTASPAGALTNTGANASYSGPITLGSASTITATSSGTLTCSGTVGTGAFALTLDGATGSSGTMSGIISTPASITKDGTGTWTLSGANTYTGTTTISAGILKLGASTSALGTIAGITSVTTGAVLDLNGFTLSNAEPLTLNGTGISTGGALINSSATGVTYNGAITLGSASSIGATGNITLGSGGISGGQDLTKVGGAILSLGSGTATLGGLTISAGTLTATSATMNLAGNYSNGGTFTHNSGTVNFNGSTAQTIGGSASSTFNNLTIANTSGGVSLTKNETVSGVLTLTNGILGTDATNFMAVTNTAIGAVTGVFASSYVNGPLQWSLLSGNSYLFPVGDATNYRPFELNNIVCSSPAVRVTMSSTGASTVDGTLSSVAARNWYAQLMGGTFTSATVRLTESGLIGANAVASATAAQSGPYTDRGGNSIAGGTITSDAAISYTGSTYFAIGTRRPAVALSNNGTQVTATNIVGGANNVVLHQSALAVTLANATLTGMTCTTAGSYVSADMTNLKAWYQTTSTFNAGTATLLSTLTTPGAAGAKTFPAFVSQSITSGTTGYIFITGDVAPGAVPGHTINLSALATSNFTFTLATKTGSTTAGGDQTVVPGPLDHFAISTISSPQTAGTAISGITLTAQDVNNNTVTSFVATVVYSGTAGITGTSATFTAGVLSGVSVTPTVSGTALTFVVTGSTMTGTATIATINPGALDHFAISTINSPQNAGIAITGITLTAKDINNNTVSSFVSTVAYSGTTGITGTSAAFTAGVLSGVSVTPTVAGTNMTFIVTGATKTGTSTFDVNASALDHFAISTITSPQAVGTAITGITLTAQDIYNNTATSFVSTVAYSGTAGITGTSTTFTAGVLSGVSVTPTVSGTSLTFVVTGSTKTGSATIATINPGAPTAISATPGSINFGDTGTISLAASGGGGSGATLTWYAGGCGSGTSIGTGSPLVISKPAITTTYYARWESGLVNSSCLSTTVTVLNTTFYSYQSGDWNTANTWTTDPSGSFWVNGGIPASTDHVIILNGRTISVNENGKSVTSLEIRLGGTLDLQTTTTHNFGTVTGEGILKLASGNFPGGSYTGFVAATGGTVEYYNLNNQSLSSTQLTYNKLIVSNYTASAYTTYLDNASNNISYTVNGTFDLNKYGAGNLTFNFGNPTPSDNLINMTVAGNFSVSTGCTIGVNNFATAHTLASSDVNASLVNPVHSLTLYGNFTNNGSVRFTGLPAPFDNAYYLLTTTAFGGTNYGDVQVTFAGPTNNTVTCNGTTDFFRFIVEKGSDQTYSLEVNSSNMANFTLFGPNNQGNNNFAGYGYYYKALFLHYGTLKLNSNINVPSISEGGQDFLLNPSAFLWVNGANVSTTVTGLNGTGYQAATFYGRLRVSAGQFSTGDAAGIVLGDLSTPEINIEGTGTLDVSQVWNNTGATNLISYTQTGGTANFRLQGENHAGAVLSLDNPNTVFNMSGGSINFTDNAFVNATTDFRLFNIQVLPGKYTVTGGTINVNVPSSATVYTGNTTVPFYNMNITNRTGSGNVTLQMATPGSTLTVLNDLSIGNGATLDMNTNTIGLEVDHNFSLASAATYTPGANTTTFNGSGVQTFTNTGSITSGLNNFTLSNASNTNITNNLTVRGLLTINNGCSLNDQGFTIYADGNIINSGTHNSQANGSILLNGTLAQTIGGSGTGIFGNLGINKTTGTASFTFNQTINGNLRLVNGILDIASFNLKFSATSAIYDALTGTATPTTFGDTKMIKSAGNQSDGGITKTFSAIGSFLYPFGSTTYHPATIDISQAPTHWGDVTAKPIAFVHPSADPTKNSLTFYWKVTSSSITGIQPGSVSHTYHYIAGDVVGNDNTYITGVYRPFAWVKGDALQVDIIGKNIYFPAIQYLDGEYTAGETLAFGTVKVFYSIANGDWGSLSTWSNISHTGAAVTSLPTANDLVVIGDGGSNNHMVTISANTKIVSSLQINTGSTLDVNTTTGHVFGSVTGTGKLRVSSSTATAVFPSGDFGNFLGASGGTVEYYTETAPGNIGVAFTMPTTYLVGSNPTNIASYYNLILSPATGKNITMPNTDLQIYQDMNINVSGSSVSGLALLNIQNTTRNITINRNLNVNNGNLQFTNGGSTAQNVSVAGDVTVASGAIFDVAANLAATNTLSMQGSLTNNGIFDMIAGASQICNVTFTGAANKQIGGTTATRTDFNALTINKGTDRTSILEATVNAMTLNSTLATAMTLTNGTFRLSNSNVTLTLSTTNAFTIPSTGCLSANLGTMNIGAANNNASDLLLLGKLEILNAGIANIGNNGGSNNDIEYAASGAPEINISGGSLNADGQVRRNLANTLGSLIYNQSGGTVTVKGNSFDATRSMFEVLNTGSQFNVTGGSIIIVKAGSSYADFYLEPGSYIVNGSNGGHTVTIGNSSTAAAQTFKLNAVAPLWNLTVDGTTNNKTASLSINSISILHNLTINGTGSIFRANDLSVTIGGSLINNNTTSTTGTNAGGYQASVAASSTQTTTFTGTGNITGTGSNLTNFANLVIGSLTSTPSITLGSSSNIRVNTNLTITSGTLADAANTITAMGDISNSAIHSSSSSSGGILLANSAKQTITTSGSGKFGNITLNNANGADIIGDSWITGQLTLTSGLLYINDYLLVMDINSSFGGTYDINRMIKLNGANSDKGVQKYFSGSATNFVFPIGSTGKYRPVTFTFTSANAGSITVVPVNTAHPSDFTPTTDQLNYYWKTTVTGLSGVSAVTQVYQYGTAEVTGTEINYISARFSSSLWVQYSSGSINATNHTITVNDLFTGEYTAGEIANFGLVHTLYTIASGNWNNTAIWAEDAPTNPTCNCYPLGNPVFIQPGHTVTMNINSASAASVDIQGTFDLKQSINHSLGSITDTTHAGTGKMMIENSTGGMFVFPGGNYDRFMASTGTTVELYGSIDAQMPLKPGNLAKPYQNLILTGPGIKYMSADVTKILGNLTINNGAKLSATLHNMPLHILNNWTDFNVSPSTGGFIPGTGFVSFEGGTAQTMTISSGAITENFYDFAISNPAGVTITGGGNALIANNLTLTSGAITTNATNTLTLTNASTSAVSGGSVSSYINGPLRKQISNGSFFTFPLGKSSPSPRYGQVYLSGVVTAGVWEAEYFNNSPNSNSPSLTITNMLTPVASVSNNEYWRVRGVGSGSANATLRWDANSGYHLSTPSDRSKIRVVEWVPSNSRWENRGNVVTDNGPDAGLVTTDAAIALADGTDLHYLTIGGGSLPLPTATITSPLTAAICNDNVASTTVTVALTGTAPWSLTYQLGSVTTTLNNIASSPVSIVLTSGSQGITQPITTDTNFNFHITNVNDFNGVAGIGDYTTTAVITVHPMPDNTITGRTQVGINEVVAYTTPTDANTYAWTLSSNGTPLTGNTSTYTVTWGTNTPGPYTIGLTKTTSAGCQSTNSISVTTSTTPTPVITGNQKVCTGATETYSTPLVSGHSYAWSLSGNGVINSGASTNSISVTWGVVSINNSVSVVESITATPAIQGSASKTVDIGVQPTNTPTFSGPSSVCVGVGPVFTINNSELNVRYQLRNNADNSNSGLFVDGTGGSITLTGSPIVTNTVYNIYGYTLAPFTCNIQLTGTHSVAATPFGSWVGGTSIDWNTAANWTCSQIPGISTNVSIGTATNYPTLNGGSVGTANNLSIGSGASLTVTGNTLQIAGAIANSGTFTASGGTIEMKGSSAQTIPANTFAGNTIASLTVNNSAGVTLSGALNVTDIVKATLGNLAANGNLTLKSSASQTALIDGSGAGAVTGNVTMERYIPSAFGYKYLSSPFTSASLSATLSGNATIPTFYAYNEDNSTIILGVTTYISGWATTGVTGLSPMTGYAANFGDGGNQQTFSMTGSVNDGSMSATLYNHNRTYTQGFNLVGNPYPSPINWNLANRTNVDNAIWFFNASGASDQYSGVYDSYINGVSSGGSTNIIPSMQGFFVHVTNTGSGSLDFSNAMRTTDLNPTYKAARFDPRPIMRFSASLNQQNALVDAYVIYFDNKTTRMFDSEYDALKLMNTDVAVPNIYEIAGNSQYLSISGMPEPVDSLTRIPIGIKALKEGWMNIAAVDLSKLPSDLTIYLEDKSNNVHQDLRKEPKYRFYANKGDINNRFSLVLAMVGYKYSTTSAPVKLFTLSRTAGTLIIKSNLPEGIDGKLKITNMLGQTLLTKNITFNQSIEVGVDWQSGIYVVTLVSGGNSYSEKTIIRRK